MQGLASSEAEVPAVVQGLYAGLRKSPSAYRYSAPFSAQVSAPDIPVDATCHCGRHLEHEYAAVAWRCDGAKPHYYCGREVGFLGYVRTWACVCVQRRFPV